MIEAPCEDVEPCTHENIIWPSNYEWYCYDCGLEGRGQAYGGDWIR